MADADDQAVPDRPDTQPWTVEDLDELRAENSRLYAEHGGDHRCLFDDDTDDTIPEGCGCGDCSCHLTAPCRHCLVHLASEESHYIHTMLSLQGRTSR